MNSRLACMELRVPESKLPTNATCPRKIHLCESKPLVEATKLFVEKGLSSVVSKPDCKLFTENYYFRDRNCFSCYYICKGRQNIYNCQHTLLFGDPLYCTRVCQNCTDSLRKKVDIMWADAKNPTRP